MKQLAIIGPTASGKSDLAVHLAQNCNAVILSIDSLSIYKTIDIASAKPTTQERSSIPHYGIDVLSPLDNASVFTFMDEYKKAHEEALKWDKNLILVGGSSFYLKSMIDGLSPLPNISDEVRLKAALMLQNLADTHAYLNSIDPQAMSKITPSDIYRIEKMLHIYLQTNTPPSQWFQMHPPTPIIQNCPVLTIQIDRSLLRERIFLRTQKMVKMGLIDEVAQLDRLYGRLPNSMNAIGLVETLEFLDGKYDKQTLIEEISTHTAQLAKRQQTFNAHQFVRTINASVQELEIIGRKILEENE